MKIRIVALLAIGLLAGCADDTADSGITAPAAQPAAAATDAPATAKDEEGATPRTGSAAAGKAATATGTVESVDVAAGKIVIAHGPVEALQWPAMTMGFEATPAQIQAVQPGQRVEFQFDSQGAKNTLLHIDPME